MNEPKFIMMRLASPPHATGENLANYRRIVADAWDDGYALAAAPFVLTDDGPGTETYNAIFMTFVPREPPPVVAWGDHFDESELEELRKLVRGMPFTGRVVVTPETPPVPEPIRPPAVPDSNAVVLNVMRKDGEQFLGLGECERSRVTLTGGSRDILIELLDPINANLKYNPGGPWSLNLYGRAAADPMAGTFASVILGEAREPRRIRRRSWPVGRMTRYAHYDGSLMLTSTDHDAETGESVRYCLTTQDFAARDWVSADPPPDDDADDEFPPPDDL